MTKEKIVLAYSGGLDTSVSVKWIQEKYGYDVIALGLDVGEGNIAVCIAGPRESEAPGIYAKARAFLLHVL